MKPVTTGAATPIKLLTKFMMPPIVPTPPFGAMSDGSDQPTGVAAPVVTGFIVGATNSFANAFLIAGVILVIGIVSFVFVMGRIEPIAEPEAQVTQGRASVV
jgi:hypothetical protein